MLMNWSDTPFNYLPRLPFWLGWPEIAAEDIGEMNELFLNAKTSASHIGVSVGSLGCVIA